MPEPFLYETLNAVESMGFLKQDIPVNPHMPEEAVRQLYVNLSEMDNAQFNVSQEDKALNRAFYGESQ